MTWVQNINPTGSTGLSALLATLPILFLFYALAVKRMKGHHAGLITLLIANVVAIAAFKMPASFSLVSTGYGMIYGLFPIGWIIITAVFLYNITVKTGQFEIIKDSIASITDDRRLQALLIAFCFGAFLEGAAGYGTPVAISGAMMVGLGFNPLYAAGLCLIANTAPVAFGGIGIPIITAGQVTGLDAMAISQMVGRQLPLLSLLIPMWLVIIMAGWKGMKEVFPAVLVCGGSFAVSQWFSANYMSPMLPDIVASLVSLVAMVVFLKYWKPKNVWRFPSEPKASLTPKKHSGAAILKAWSPFIILTVLIGDWGIQPVKVLLDKVTMKFHFPLIDQAIISAGKPIAVLFKFNWLSAAGTAILITAAITAVILRLSISDFFKLFGNTLKTLKFPLLTVASVLGFAYVSNYSGMSGAMASALTMTGKMFAFVSPILGWLGVFITGSDTSANALFGKLQQVSAEHIGVNPILTVAANSSGGVTGKMISPQSIAVATASVGLVGKESDLFRFTVKHSLLFALVISVMTYIQAYYLAWMIPAATKAVEASAATSSAETGSMILIGSFIFVLLISIFALKTQKANEAAVARR